MTSLFVHVEVKSRKMKHLEVCKMFCYIEWMSTPRMITKTLKLRIKERHAKVLQMMASQVNQVWNFCNELSYRAILERQQWFSGFDLQKYTAGFSQCDGILIGSATVQEVCKEYALRRKQFKKSKLRWRVSDPQKSKYSLGWIPFKGPSIRYHNGQLAFAGHRFNLWDSYGLSNYVLKAGCFTQDPRGRWYVCITVEVATKESTATQSVGIDPGCHTAFTCSDGTTLQGHWYRDLQKKLGQAQRAHKKDRARAIHAQIANQRKNALHHFTTDLVRRFGAIFVGDISSQWALAGPLAKSAQDASWAMCKKMLDYKSRAAGVFYEEVKEHFTTQTCSSCKHLPPESPRGRAGLGIRQWTCGACGTLHDRDVNSAKNIVARGHSRLAEGIFVL